MVGLGKEEKKKLEEVYELIFEEFSSFHMIKSDLSFNLKDLIRRNSGGVLGAGGMFMLLGLGREEGLEVKREVEAFLEKGEFLLPEYRKVLFIYEYRMKIERRKREEEEEEDNEEEGRGIKLEEEDDEEKREELIEKNIWKALSESDTSNASIKKMLISFSIANIFRLSRLSSQILSFLAERSIVLAEFLEKLYRKADKLATHSFFRQFVFDRLVGELLDQYNILSLRDVKKIEENLYLTKKAVLKSLFILFLKTPLSIKIPFLPKIIPILLVSLQDPENYSDFSLLKELLLHPPPPSSLPPSSFLSTPSFPPPSSVPPSSLLSSPPSSFSTFPYPPSSFSPPSSYLPEILDFLLESLKKVDKMEFLIEILECLGIGAGLEGTLIGNRKNKIISEVRPFLGHRKRRVRKAAREAVNKWYGV